MIQSAGTPWNDCGSSVDSTTISGVSSISRTPHPPLRGSIAEPPGTVIAVGLTSQEPRAGFPLTLETKRQVCRSAHG
jgi:hypothetical protein